MLASILRLLPGGCRNAGLLAAGVSFSICLWNAEQARAQVMTFGGDAQHTSNYSAPAHNLNAIKWSASVDLNNSGAPAHYGSPLVTPGNSVIVPVKIAANGFKVDVFDGGTGTQKYTLSTDYILPAHRWIPTYNPCLVKGSHSGRLYYAGAGGTLWYLDNPDANTPGTPVRLVFYTSLANYLANADAYNSAIFINTPITADSQGNVFFGFRVQGTAPAPLNTTRSGFARLDAQGNGTYVLANEAANDALISRDSHNCAPALSNDERTLYVVVKWAVNSNYGYLLGLDAATLATKYRVLLKDPRNDNPAGILDDGTASPMVAPDGDVYLGVFANPSNGSRGFLLRFSGDLATVKTPGGFGWDYTPAIVPASMVPSYKGASAYLLFCKYNNYRLADGDGINRVALLDPNATQIDPHPSASGLIEMREVLTAIGPTPDRDYPSVPNAVREWCINIPAVNPAANSVYFDSADGRLYRWNLAANSLDQAIALTPGIGEPYVPTVIGPDGTLYTINGGTLFAVGHPPGPLRITLHSSSPDLRDTVRDTSLTFTAQVHGWTPQMGGTVTFTALAYHGLTPVTTTLASKVRLNASGSASVTTSALSAGGTNLGSHFITATYRRGEDLPDLSVTFVQKIHAHASRTMLVSSANPSRIGQPVTFTATVAPASAGAGTPTGMVTFLRGGESLGQVPLDSSGVAALTRANLPEGNEAITAVYASDTHFAASRESVAQSVRQNLTPPSTPEQVTAAWAPGERKIGLKWAPSKDPDDPVIRYEVWTSGSLSGVYAYLATTADTFYVDSLPARRQARWYYYIVAVDPHGNRSAASARVTP